MIRALVESGVRVTLAAEPSWRGQLKEHMGSLLEHPGLRVVYGPPLKRPLPVSLAAALRLLADPAHDLLLVANNSRGVLPAARMLMAARRAKRMLVWAHQFPRPSYAKQLRAFKTEILAVSEAVGAAFRSSGPWPVTVSYGLPNADTFSPRQRPRESGPVRFCVLGVLDTPWKGAKLALRAWDLLPERLRGKAQLHLCAYTHKPETTNADVVLHDWKNPSAVAEFLRSMDAIIVPSTSLETFSQVTVQGMLTGLPVIAYDLPVLKEKLDTGGGIVFHTSEELARHVERLTDNETERVAMGAIARETALRRYIWRPAAFIERYLQTPTAELSRA